MVGVMIKMGVVPFERWAVEMTEGLGRRENM